MTGLYGLIKLTLSIIAGLIAIVVHEFPKAALAVGLGDDTPKYNGKLTLNPFKHMDPIGFIMLISTFVGWSYPVEFNPNNFKNRKRGTIFVATIGIISSFMFAVIMIFLTKQLFSLQLYNLHEYVIFFTSQLVIYSLSIALFNILPIPPLSITKIISVYWPRTYFRILQYEKMIHVAFLLLLFLNIVPMVINNVRYYLLYILQLII